MMVSPQKIIVLAKSGENDLLYSLSPCFYETEPVTFRIFCERTKKRIFNNRLYYPRFMKNQAFFKGSKRQDRSFRSPAARFPRQKKGGAAGPQRRSCRKKYSSFIGWFLL